MKEDHELLNRIHRNTQMGIETLPLLASRAEDVSFQNTLREQLAEYRELNRKAEKLMKSQGMPVRGISNFSQMMATAMTNMKTLTNRSTSHLAEMAIQGSNMGVTKITKALHRTSARSAEAKALADQVLRTEDRNLRELREFL